MKHRACMTRSLARSTSSPSSSPGGQTTRCNRQRPSLPVVPSPPTRRSRVLQISALPPCEKASASREIARYKWLGAQTAAATVEALNEVEPGLSEYDLEAITAGALLRRGILPSVYLYAVDDRILKYKHAVPRGKRLKQYGMLNLCSRKWGLAISITRFIHFGPLPAELAKRFQAAAEVNAALLNATRVGATSAELFRVAQAAYTAQGFPGEERFHHQGGPTGYGEREWVATPNGTEVVVNNQAFAWNPSIRGGKTEDTFLLRDGVIENLTPTLPELPTIEAKVKGEHLRCCRRASEMKEGIGSRE